MERAIEAIQLMPHSTEVSGEEKDYMNAPDPEASPIISQAPVVKVSLRQLIDKLNSLNFQECTIDIVFKHKFYPRDITLRAYPLPCSDASLACRWAEKFDFKQLVDAYTFHHFNVPKGQQFLEVLPEVRSFNEEQILFILPETCREISVRKRRRHPCIGITAHMFQNGAAFPGRLIDYGARQFRIVVSTLPPQNFRWINEDSPVTVVFAREDKTLYSGECDIVRHDFGKPERHFTLEPLKRQLKRFAPRQYRTTRHQLTPSPEMSFVHPLFGKRVNLKVHDLSGAGLSVEEEVSAAVLLPGLIIPKLELTFSDGSALSCMAQVLYCKTHKDRKIPVVHCGLAILDISVNDHMRLLGLMHRATDAQCYVCNKVDISELWDFFFETGFVYPQKYESIQANKAHIKATYETLYNNSPSIGSHFIYKQYGRIMAHAATMRFYESSWMLHHHAAVRTPSNRGGLIVLNQSGRFINESHRLSAMNMDYVFCYFRPENKFPSHVFGGSARNIKNPKVCSLDLFAYTHHSFDPIADEDLPGGWQLDEAREEDLKDLQTFYESQSGGLMLRGLHLSPDRFDCSGVMTAFHKIGLKRERHLLALRYRDKLCAILMANVADVGLNMSGLTNAVTIIEVDPEPLTHDIVRSALNRLSQIYDSEQVPVLLYPQTAAARMGMASEKSYYLWVYDTQNLDYYFKFLKRLLKFIQH